MFDGLTKQLLEVKDVDKLLDTPGGKRFIEFISVCQYEMNGLIAFYKKVIIPAINRNSVEQLQLWRQSRYSRTINIVEDHFREDKFMMIRLAYVQLYHRYESFINGLLTHCEQLSETPSYPPGTLYDYITTKLEVDLKRPSYHQTLKEVNFVANCVKHTNGLPTRSSPPERFRESNKTIAIRIPDAELYNDIKAIRILMAQIIQHVLHVHMFLLLRDIGADRTNPLQFLSSLAVSLSEASLHEEFRSFRDFYKCSS